VHGVIPQDAVLIDAPIGRAHDSRVLVRRAVVASSAPRAQAARTEVTVVQRFAAHTLVSCVPLTGRTHQLRVHLAHLGHPILGDKLYGRSDEDYESYVQHLKQGGHPSWDGRLGAPRQMLHARWLALAHPRHGGRLEWQAPDPADWQAVVERL
jgi:23S rRNA pseudouridine1911/1915/1917 synthase